VFIYLLWPITKMTKTKNSEYTNQRELEIRKSRLNQTKQYILSNSISGVLNNQKWHNIFDRLDDNKKEFLIKTLLSGQEKNCKWIRELEKTAILIDDFGDFTEFLEIERLIICKSRELIEFLDSSNIEYYRIEENIEIYGYKK
jgi:hypothetical protein